MKLSSEQRALTKYLINEKGYTQMINQYTTDYRTQIDHIYTNVPHQVKSAGTLESTTAIISQFSFLYNTCKRLYNRPEITELQTAYTFC